MKQTIKTLIESSGLFKFLKATKDSLIFWSDEFENEYTIPRSWDYDTVNNWLTQIKSC